MINDQLLRQTLAKVSNAPVGADHLADIVDFGSEYSLNLRKGETQKFDEAPTLTI